jgi:hypothetical protein
MLQICKFPGLTAALLVPKSTAALLVPMLTAALLVPKSTAALLVPKSVRETYKFVTLLQICNISTNL